MGVSARPAGKTKGMFVRIDNGFAKEREAELKAKSKKKGRANE